MHSASSILAQSIVFNQQQQDYSRIPKIIVNNGSDLNIFKNFDRLVGTENDYSFHHYWLNRLEDNSFSRQLIFEYSTGNTYSYKDLATFIRKSSHLLKEITSNQYVLFISLNSIKYLALYFGIICNGAIPMNVPFQNNSIQNIQTFIIQHNVQYLILDRSTLEWSWFLKFFTPVSVFIKKVFIFNSTGSEKLPKHNEKIAHLDKDWLSANYSNDSDDLYHITSSFKYYPCLAVNSGANSGEEEWPPRLFLYGHHAMITCGQILSDEKLMEFKTIDSLLCYGSFEHLENLLMFISGIVNGCRIVLVDKYDPEQMIDAINKQKITSAMLPVNFLLKLMKDDLSLEQLSLDYLIRIIVFGDKMPLDLCRKFQQRFPMVTSLRNCYIMAETPVPVAMMTIRNPIHYQIESAGFPLANTRIKVVSMINRLEMLDSNRCGFVCIARQRHMFALGYLSINSRHLLDLDLQVDHHQRNQDNAGNHINNHNNNQNYWLITDDIGYYDNNGLIYLHGQLYHSGINWLMNLNNQRQQQKPMLERQENIINSIIERSRIEGTILEHPLVSEVWTMQTEWQRYAVMVVLKFQQQKQEQKQLLLHHEILSKQIIDYVNKQNMQNLGAIGQLFIVDNLVKTNNGRYCHCILRKRIRNFINIERKY